MKAHYSAELDSEIANRYKEAVAKKEDLGWLDEATFVREGNVCKIGIEKSLRACLGPKGIDGMLEVMSSMAFDWLIY